MRVWGLLYLLLHKAHMIGKRVLPLRGSDTWQRYVDCDPETAVPVPDDIPGTLAARAYINPLSALLSQWVQADGARLFMEAVLR